MNSEVLEVRDLAVGFRQGDANSEVVSGVSFSLIPGKTLALVGESGSGKSVTAHAMMRLLPYPMAYHSSGEIVYKDQDLLTFNESRMQAIRGNEIGMIFQEPMTALNPLHKIEKQISEVVCQHQGISRRQAKDKVVELLSLVQIPDPEQKLESYPHQLSGGQRQRIMIAMALANEPKILIADEPTTALDVTVQREILDLLKSLQAQRQLSILLITHDLGVVKYMADDVAVMKDGKLVETGSTDDIFDAPRHDYTKKLMNSTPKGGPVALVSQDDEEPLLLVKNLKVSFVTKTSLFGAIKASFSAVKDATLHINSGETLGVVGESGSGKSTLALAVLRLIESQGLVQFNGVEVSGINEKHLRSMRREFQVVFQDPFASLSPRMTVAEIVQEGLKVHGELSEEQRREKMLNVIHEVGLDASTLDRYPHEFSGGQRQRIAIARALILEPKLIVLDEPTSALDRAVQVQVIDLLRELQSRRNLSYLFISHDLKVVQALSHRVLVMKYGEIVESGTTEEVLQRPTTAYTQALVDASFN
ncbi:MAG: ABC transporter ATP-binding protein [Cellvibrionaceae bacterium]